MRVRKTHTDDSVPSQRLPSGAGTEARLPRRSRRASALSLATLLSLCFAPACQKRDAEKCTQGFDVTRQAVKVKDFAAAKQWREYAYKECDAAGEDQAALAALDQEVAQADAAAKAAAAAEASRKQLNDALLKLFVTWVGDNRAAPDKASSAPICDPLPDDPALARKLEASKERFCVGTRTAGTSVLAARYWDADKTIARFSTQFPAPVSCEDFGGAVSKTWDVPALDGRSVKRSRCEISAGPLSGLSVVVSAAVGADAYVFTPSFLEKDPVTKQIAGG